MADRLTEGRYFCRVESQEVKLSQNDNWMVNLWIKPMLFDPGGNEEKVAVEAGQLENHRLIYFGTITKKSVKRVVKELRAVGFTGDDPALLHKTDGEHDLSGKEAWFILRWRPSNDDRPDFESWRPETIREASAPSPVTDQQLAELTAKFGSEFASGSGETAEVSKSEWSANEL